MPRFQKHLSLAKPSVFVTLLLFVSVVAAGAFAQLNTSNSSTTPLAYDTENTGASFAAPVFPDFAHLPIIRPLPDPFVFFSDGTRDTSFTKWEQRRNEIKASIEKYEIGPKPDCHDCTITATYVPAVPPSTRGTLTINVTRNGVTITIPTRVYIPTGMGNGPFPAIIPMVFAAGSSGLGRGSLPAAAFTGLPIASVDFPHNAVTTYGGPRTTDNFYKLYPELCAGTTNCTAMGGSNSGQYAAWSWGVSRVIDGIILATKQATNPLPIDVHHLAVTGCSYAGKMALFAGAFDERVALTIAQENGGGGAPAWRVSQQIEADDVVENLTHTDHNWFASQMWQFQDSNVYKLPHDHHELMAMIAPRALLETGNTDFNWLSNRSNTISSRATQQVYNTLGIGDRFGFYIDGGHAHCGTLPAEAPVIASWLNKFLLGDATANTDTQVTPYPTIDAGRWTAWWGSNDPKFPNDWNPGDGTLVTHMNRFVKLNFGDDVLAGYGLYMDGAHPDATVQVVGAFNGTNVQADVSCPDGSSYTLTVPMPDATYSIPAGDNSWYPSPNQKSSLVYQGSATNSSPAACNGGVARNFYFSALGKQATRGAGNPGGPGFPTTDTTDPLNVRFHCDAGNKGAGGSWSPTVTVKYQP
jgi:hypothetical protein